jgi:arsenate reductase
MAGNRETSLGLRDNIEVLHRIAARLGERFTGIFAAETVERYVSKGAIATDVPEVLFVCVQNAGRSQMASELDPAVVTVMSEMGLDLSQNYPKQLTDDVVRASDVVITMGCGDSCPIYPGKTLAAPLTKEPTHS